MNCLLKQTYELLLCHALAKLAGLCHSKQDSLKAKPLACASCFKVSNTKRYLHLARQAWVD